jgi:hypothetical protein
LSDAWLPEVEVPDEFEETGRRGLEGIISVGGKQGVYVDIENLKGVPRATYTARGPPQRVMMGSRESRKSRT